MFIGVLTHLRIKTPGRPPRLIQGSPVLRTGTAEHGRFKLGLRPCPPTTTRSGGGASLSPSSRFGANITQYHPVSPNITQYHQKPSALLCNLCVLWRQKFPVPRAPARPDPSKSD